MARRIQSVQPNSIAAECGLMPGDTLLSVSGSDVRDYIDYTYLVSDEEIILLIEKIDGTLEEIEIEKEVDEDLGLIFENDGFGRKIVCKNKCLFCFVDQMPAGMRKTLYVKDDDWRTSFLMGSYITLTNMPQQTIERIVKQKISPLYVSVHAYDEALHNKLLANPHAEKTFDILRYWTENGIQCHTQIVMCEDLNDGDELKKTIENLYALYPGILSVAVVPVGLTKFREGLYPLHPISKKVAEETIDVIEDYQRRFLQDNQSTRFVFAADELYIRAQRPMPGIEAYEQLEQIENGVGMVSVFLEDAKEALVSAAGTENKYNEVAVATGHDFYPFMKKIAEDVENVMKTKINVYKITNDFFGETVTVTGLLTGRDVIRQLKGKKLGDALLLSSCCFKEHEDAMLDDITIRQVENELGVPCVKVENDGYAFVEALAKRSIL
ncbi:MAG: DUF512 domain-containing protein [Christensenella sp.]|nr:DUF512 domain-containing protein [Christensenella sp.]